MRNNMIVNNTAYYDLSFIERGSSAIVINNVANGEDYLQSSFATVNNMIINNNTFDINIDYISTVIIDNSEDFKYKMDHYDLYVIKDEKDVFSSIEKNIDYLNYNITNGIEYSINVLDKKDRYYDYGIVYLNISDKHLNINFKYSMEPIELNNVVLKDYISKIKNIGQIVNVADFSKQNDIINHEKECRINVLKRREEQLNIATNTSIVIKGQTIIDNGWENKPAIEIGVSNIMTEGEISSGSNSGGDLKLLSFTIQQMSFFEFKLKFENKKVEDIFNLPTGLFFDKDRQRIIGTPMQSGRYGFSLIFDNSSTLNGFIEVPKLQREL